MGSIAFGDVVPDCDASAAYDFLKLWHRWSEGYIVISRIDPRYERPISSAYKLAQLLEVVKECGLNELVASEDAVYQVYYSVGAHSSDPCGEHGKRKGGKSTVAELPGVWLDLDVKDGAFESIDHIREFAAKLPLFPTAAIASGSGGVHLYWAYDHAPVTGERGEMACLAWWARCNEIANEMGVSIDKLNNADRIMRLPGTVRWPKEHEGAAAVSLLKRDGPHCSIGDIREHATSALLRWQKHIAERHADFVRDEGLARAIAMEAANEFGGQNSWMRLLASSTVEDVFNVSTSWDQILLPHGWTLLEPDCYDARGRRVWCRPGSHSKSAYTDWSGNPHVMALHTDSPSSGLARLKLLDIKPSKLRVHAELKYGGDMAACLRDIYAKLRS